MLSSPGSLQVKVIFTSCEWSVSPSCLSKFAIFALLMYIHIHFTRPVILKQRWFRDTPRWHCPRGSIRNCFWWSHLEDGGRVLLDLVGRSRDVAKYSTIYRTPHNKEISIVWGLKSWTKLLSSRREDFVTHSFVFPPVPTSVLHMVIAKSIEIIGVLEKMHNPEGWHTSPTLSSTQVYGCSPSMSLQRRARASQGLQVCIISLVQKVQLTASEHLLSITVSLVVHILKKSFKLNCLFFFKTSKIMLHFLSVF